MVVMVNIFFIHGSFAYSGEYNQKITKTLSEKINSVPKDEKIRVIIKLKEPEIKSQSVRGSVREGVVAAGGRVVGEFSTISGMIAEIPASKIPILANNPDVELIVEDRPVRAFLTESVPLINAEDVWSRIIGGSSITGRGQSVCIIDTGVNYTHPDLGGGFGSGYKVLGGYDFVNNDPDPMDDDGHGTHVAGIVAANGSIKGVAPDAGIVAIKVLNASGSGLSSDVLAGIDWCVSNASVYNITVISMSLGGSELYTTYCDASETLFRDAINAAVARNISVVVATGNDANYTALPSPACIRNATRVGATYDANVGGVSWGTCNDGSTYADKITCFTNRGAGFPDILLAPGALINSTSISGGYAVYGGTSMAAPHVSGVIALLNQEYRAFYGTAPAPEYLFSVLNSTGVPIYDTATGATYYRVDALAAYEAISPEPPSISFVPPTPENSTFWRETWAYINVTFSEPVDTALLEWNGTNITMLLLSGKAAYYNLTNLSEGSYFYRVYANDTYGNMNVSEMRVLTVDFTPPLPVFVPPTPDNATTVSVSYVFVNITTSEPLNRSILEWNRVNETMKGSGQNWYLNVTSLPNGNYTFRVHVQDLAGNWNSSGIRVVEVDAPLLIYVESPQNRSYPVQDVHFNITANKPLVSANVSIDAGANYTLINDSAAHWYNTSISLVEGAHNATFYVLDTAGNLNFTTVFFTIDTTPPDVSFIPPTPLNGSVITARSITVNVTHAELHPDTLVLNWNGTSYRRSYSGSYTAISMSNLPDGRHTFYVWVNDTAGNTNTTEVREVLVDTLPPEVSNITPASGSAVRGVVTISAIVRDAGVGVASVIANISNATYSESLSLSHSNSGLWYAQWDTSALSDGDYTLSINASDALGRSTVKSVSISVDTTPPVLALLPPTPASGAVLSSSTTSVTVNISISEPHPDTLVLSWNGVNQSVPSPGSVVSLSRSVSPGGSYTFYVWMNDTAGNVNFTPSISFSVASAAGSGGGGGGGGAGGGGGITFGT
ncbi:MAG: S8 family serine peptidase, partial [Euryarchaeota archaeon]|nr:S8 family serine peptidase [Euryarchaeota archaeon]